jgi:predicted DNA-binding transcriptional regulator YafY
MYQPTTRLLTVLEMLQAQDVVSGTAIARRLEVDRRSVRRYVVSLQDLGIPVDGVRGRYGGYRLGPGRRLAPLILTDDQAVAVALGLLGLRQAGPTFGSQDVDDALARLGRVLPEALRRRVDALGRAISFEPVAAADRPDGTLVARLSEAAIGGRRVWIRYRAADGRETERELDPYGIAVAIGHWYVVGRCHLRRGVRSFRIDRIAAIRPVPASFVAPAGFDVLAYLTRGIAAMPARYLADVRFPVEMTEVVGRVPAAYALFEAEGDVAVRSRVPTDDLALHARWLVGLGLPFEVIDPPELRAALHDLADDIHARAG